MAAEGENKGKVIAYVDSIALDSVKFKVSQKGRERLLAKNRKNVHAFICGTWVENAQAATNIEVTYNPYKYSSFVRKLDEQPINCSASVIVIGRNVLAA